MKKSTASQLDQELMRLRVYGHKSPSGGPCVICGAGIRKIAKDGSLLDHCLNCEGMARRYKKYGITHKEFEERMAEQGNVCPICLLPFDVSNPFVLDHCHKTGLNRSGFRGVLHRRCNALLGLLREDPDNAARAGEYIAKWNTKLGENKKGDPVSRAAPNS